MMSDKEKHHRKQREKEEDEKHCKILLATDWKVINSKKETKTA